jgi:hypothetical protein
MPRKSKADLLEHRMIEELQRLAFSPTTSATAKSKSLQTLSALLRRRAKRHADKADVAAARRAEKAKAEHKWPSVLPENHRLIRS